MNFRKGGKNTSLYDDNSSHPQLNLAGKHSNPGSDSDRYKLTTQPVEDPKKLDDEQDRNEIQYYDKDRLDVNRSPLHEGRPTQDKRGLLQRSPQGVRSSVLTNVKKDLNDITDVNRNPIQTLNINLPMKRDENYEHSPKTIYLGTQNIFELNTKTRDRRASPSQQQGYVIDSRPYDNPISRTYIPEEKKNNHHPEPELFERPTTLGKKMSPNLNLENNEEEEGKENTVEAKKRTKKEKIEKLKNMKSKVNPDQQEREEKDTEENPERDNLYKLYDKDFDKLESMPVRSNNFLRRKHTGFTLQKNEGKLVPKNFESYNPFITLEEYKDRQKVIQKMNRLSNLMLKTNTHRNRSQDDDDDIKPLRMTTESMLFRPQKNKRFIRVTLAILKSKGPNCEDRMITRDMRTDKGGVVDLAHKSLKSKQYKIKKVDKRTQKSKSPPQKNYKDKLIASKLIQKWWRDILTNYSKTLTQIKKVQSAWRGYWVRTYLYEIVYYSILSQAFVDKFKPPIVTSVRKNIMDLLVDNFADKYDKRLRLAKIIWLQKKVKRFVQNMRDKRMKFSLRMQKIFLRPLREAFNNILDESKNYDKKALKAKKFVDKVKNVINKKTLHELNKEISRLPLYSLRGSLKNKLLRKYVDLIMMTPLKKYFGLWKKNALQQKLTPKQLENMLKSLKRAIVQPHLNDLRNRANWIKHQNIRGKLLRKMMRKAGNAYNFIILKAYFMRWLKISRDLNVLDFKGKIFDSFLFRTKAGMAKKLLRKYLRLWHLHILKKLDPEQVLNLIEGIKKPILRNVGKSAFPKILECCEGIKQKTINQLLFSRGKFRLLTLRVFFGKWKKRVSDQVTLDMVTKTLLKIRKANKTIYHFKVLMGRFQDWRRKAAMLRYLNKEEVEDVNKRKIRGATNAFDAVTKAARRIGFAHLYNPIKKNLVDIIRSKAVKAMSLMNPKLNKIVERAKLRLWKTICLALLKKDFRNKFFNKLIGNSSGKIKLNILRVFFHKWMKNREKNPLVKINRGLDDLKSLLRRKIKDDPINAFKEKLDEEDKKIKDLKRQRASRLLLKMKLRLLKGFSRNYFNLWRFIIMSLVSKEKRVNLWTKLFNDRLKKIHKRTLQYRFQFWRYNKKEFKWEEMQKINKNVTEAFEHIRNKNNKLHFPNFLVKLANTKSNKFIRLFFDKLLSYTEKAEEISKKNYLNKWRLKCKQINMKNMKNKFFKFILGNKDLNNNKIMLLRALRLWVKNTDLRKLQSNHLLNIIYGGALEHIKKVVLMRKNIFFRRLLKVMRLDTRGVLFLRLKQRLNKPRYSLSRAFDIWRRIAIQLKLIEQEVKFAQNMLFGTCKKFKARIKRDTLKRKLLLWKSKLQRPQDYYDKICRATKILQNGLETKFCSEPFTLISNHKNYQKLFDKMLPTGSKLRKRLEMERLKKSWDRWNTVVKNFRKVDWACLLMRNKKEGFLKKHKFSVLSKYFRKFAGYRPKSLNYPDVNKGLINIFLVFIRREWPFIIDQLKKHGDWKAQNNAINLLFGQSKTFLKHKLRRALLKWHRNMLKDDSFIKSKVLKQFKKMIIERYFTGPLEKGFRQWLRKMITKPLDIKRLITAEEKLREAIRRHIGFFSFPKILDHRSSEYFSRLIMTKVFPKSKFAEKRIKRLRLLKWKDQAHKLALRELRAKSFSMLYTGNKSKVFKFFLSKYFKRWYKRPVNLAKIIQGERIVFGTLVRKYMIGFIDPDMKNYAYIKFLRGYFLGTNKFFLRKLKPFYDNWANIARTMKARELKFKFWGKLCLNMKSERLRKDIERIMRLKFNLWKTQARILTDKLIKNIDEATEAIKRDTIHKHFPNFFKNLKEIADKNAKKGQFDIMDLLLRRFKKLILRKKLYLWDKKSRQLALQEFQMKFIKKHLKLWMKRVDLQRLRRGFNKFRPPKEVTVLLKNYKPIQVAAMTLRRIITRRPFEEFKKITGMMNLKIPFGMTLSQVLLKKGINVGKSFVLRAMSLRPYFKKFKNQVEAMKDRDLQEKMTKKMLFRFGDKNHKLLTRLYFNQWRDIINKMNLDEAVNETRARVTSLIYGKNKKILLRRKFVIWKKINERYFKKLNSITLGFVKLQNRLQAKYLHLLLKRIRQKGDRDLKLDKAKSILKAMLMNMRTGKLVYYFYYWKKYVYFVKLLLLKHSIFRNLLAQTERDQNKKMANRFREALLLWRIHALPKNLYEFISRTRRGTDIIMKAMRSPFNKDVFNSILRKAIRVKILRILTNLANRHSYKTKEEALLYRFRLWRMRLKDDAVLKERLRILFCRHLDQIHSKLLKLKPIQQLKKNLQKYKDGKNNSVRTLQKFFREMGNKPVLRAPEEDKKLRSAFKKSDNKKDKGIIVYYALWKKNAKLIKLEDAGKLIQNFLRGGLNNRDKNALRLGQLNEKLTKAIKNVTLRKIKKRAKYNQWLKLMLKHLKDVPPELKLNFLKLYFMRWWAHQLAHKKQLATFLINTRTRAFLARKFLKKLLLKRFKMTQLVQKLFGKHLDKLKINFLKWNLIAKIMKNSVAADTISHYLNKKVNFYLQRENKRNLRFWFRNLVRKQIADAMNKSGKLKKNSASKLYNTLRSIYWERPFEQIKSSLRFIAKIKKMKYLYPLLVEKFKNYWLPHYYRMWRDKVKDEKLKKLILLQNKIKGRLALWRERTRLRKFLLMSKYLAKMTSDNALKKKIHLHMWLNRAKNMFLNKVVVNVQKLFQGNTSRKGLDREVNKYKLKNHFRLMFLRDLHNKFVKLADFSEPLKRLVNTMNSPFENRVATNNLLEVGKNNIRNNILFKLTGKNSYKDYLTNLRRYYNLWKKNCNLLEKHAEKVQTNYRRFKSQKLLKRKLRIKAKLLTLSKKYENTNYGKLKLWFTYWRTIANFMTLQNSAVKIQSYARKKNVYWQKKKIENQFVDWAAKRTVYLVKNEAKCKRLRDKLQKISLAAFLKFMRVREKMKKVTWYLIKKFSADDENFKSLFLSKYFVDWKEKTKRINLQRQRSALLIQKNYRAYNWRKWLIFQRHKKLKMIQMIDKLTDDNDLRLRIRFCLWKNKIKSSQLSDSAKMISSLFMDAKGKARRKKNKKRLDEIKNGLEPLNNAYTKASCREPFNKVKELAKMNKLKSVLNNLCDKLHDHKKTPIDKIKEFADHMRKLRNAYSDKIKKRWRLFLYKRGIWGMINKIRRLRFILSLMVNRDKRFLNKAYKLWRYNAMGDIWLQSAKKIKEFCDRRVLRYGRQKKQDALDKLKEMLRNMFTKKMLLPYAKDYRYATVLTPAVTHLMKHIFNKLRYNIDNYEKIKAMWKLFRLPKSCILRLIGNNFYKWRDRANKIKRDKASKMITKNLRNSNKRKKYNRVRNMLIDKLKMLALKHSNLRKYYFLKWLAISKQNVLQESAKKISDFVENNWRRILARKLFKKFTDGLFNRSYSQDAFNLIVRFRKMKALEKLFKPLDHRIKRDGFDDLKKQLRLLRSILLVKSIFGGFEGRSKFLLLRAYWKKWNTNKRKLRNREISLERLNQITLDVQKINSSKAIAEFCLLKRFNNLVNSVNKIIAFWKLKRNKSANDKLRRLKEALKRHDLDIAVSNPNITSNLYKFFVYRRFFDLNRALDNYFFKKIVDPSKKHLINYLKENSLKQSNYNYQDKAKYRGNLQITKLNFKSNDISRRLKKAKLDQNDDNNSIYLVPYLFGFFIRLADNRKQWAYNKLKIVSRAKNFLVLINSIKDKKINPLKGEFINNFKDYVEHRKKIPIAKNNLRRILRKHAINELKNHLIRSRKMLRITYLCRLSLMHSEISDKRYLLKLIKLWKHYIAIGRISKQTQEMLYKGMMANYLNTLQALSDNNGAFAQVTELSEGLGTFSSEASGFEANLKKKFAKGSEVKYNFGPPEITIETEDSLIEGDKNDKYEILEGEGDESFIQGRVDSPRTKKTK